MLAVYLSYELEHAGDGGLLGREGRGQRRIPQLDAHLLPIACTMATGDRVRGRKGDQKQYSRPDNELP